MTVRIFVEGIADKKFLRDYILNKYNIVLVDEEITETGGWTKIISSGNEGEFIRNKMNQNSDNEGVNLLIFDADNNFTLRLEEIEKWKKRMSLCFEIFLLPNQSDNGDLETVLENIINPKNTPIFECWDNYEICLKSKPIESRNIPLTTPAKKTKIYGYLEALLGESKSEKKKIKPENRNYGDIEHWDLNSNFLNKLKSFLDKHLIL